MGTTLVPTSVNVFLSMFEQNFFDNILKFFLYSSYVYEDPNLLWWGTVYLYCQHPELCPFQTLCYSKEENVVLSRQLGVMLQRNIQ